VIRLGREAVKEEHLWRDAVVPVEGDIGELAREFVPAETREIGRLDASRVDRGQGYQALIAPGLSRMFEKIHEKSSSRIVRQFAGNHVELIEAVVSDKIDDKVYVDLPPERLQSFLDSRDRR
jgi:hypothetical protein